MLIRIPSGIEVHELAVRDFCQRWSVVEFSLFGLVLTDRFDEDSDVDVLVDFVPTFKMDWDTFDKMEPELSALLGRIVDLVRSGTIRNRFRQHAIEATRKVLYAE